MIELTVEQRRAVGQLNEMPPRALDPGTQTTYVLIREEIYNRVKTLFAEEEDGQFVQTMHAHAMEAFGQAGWDDPGMDVYDELDPRKQV